MGWNTALLILNDAASDIEKNPKQFISNVMDMVHGGPEAREPGHSMLLGHHGNAMSLICRNHADTTNLVTIGQNCSEIILQSSLWHGREDNNVKILRAAANALGYTLAKKPVKKTT